MCLMSLTLIARLGSRRDLGKENIIITMAAVSCSGDKCCIYADGPMFEVISIGLGRHRTNIRDLALPDV